MMGCFLDGDFLEEKSFNIERLERLESGERIVRILASNFKLPGSSPSFNVTPFHWSIGVRIITVWPVVA
jgi:hypothetical protein